MPEALLLPRRELAEKTAKVIEEYGLTVIIAPMGYGKTTLAESVAELAPGQAYFYSVPDGRHDVNFLWHDMFGRFEEQGLDIAPAIRRRGFTEMAAGRQKIFDLLRGLTTPTWFIIDDYHHVTDQAMNVFLDIITLAAIPNLHLVIFSRTRPDMRLGELHVKRRAITYEQDFLAFSEDETRDYFNINGVPKDIAGEAWRFCEGWPVALWLCLENWRISGEILAASGIEPLLNKIFSSYDRV